VTFNCSNGNFNEFQKALPMGFVKHEQNQCPILNAKQFQKISTKARTIWGLSSTWIFVSKFKDCQGFSSFARTLKMITTCSNLSTTGNRQCEHSCWQTACAFLRACTASRQLMFAGLPDHLSSDRLWIWIRVLQEETGVSWHSCAGLVDSNLKSEIKIVEMHPAEPIKPIVGCQVN
jgi:hypothetical protein